MLGRAATRGWTAALCLLALLPSGGAEIDLPMPMANGSSLLEASSTVLVPKLETRPTTLSPTSTPGSTSLQSTVEDSKGTTAALPEPEANITATTMTTSTPGNGTTLPAGTPATTTLSPTTPESAAPETSPTSSTGPTDAVVPSENSTSPKTPSLEPSTSPSPATNIIQGEIKCLSVKEVRVGQSICLRLNQTSSCEDFLRDNGEALARLLCAGEPEGGPCSWRLAQSEVAPHCLLLLMANLTELSNKLQFLRQHQSELRKLGIHELSKEDVARHQSYSRKTLIALVTAGLLLAVLGLAGYFLMNRRSWSPAGERLGEDPYFSENGGGPRASPERQPKAATSHGAQENGRAAPRNGHSAPHAVADTEL